MIQPNELKLNLPMEVGNGTVSTTTLVWEILQASYHGHLQKVKGLVKNCPDLIYAQYNYTPPIHLAVREGHLELVRYLLINGAHDPDYKIYPFLDSLQVIAEDRGLFKITDLLYKYNTDVSSQKYKGDTGRIFYKRNERQIEFERAVEQNHLIKTEEILKKYPEFAQDETFFWGEGILTFAAKENNRSMMDLLARYKAKVPEILKWAPFYYFEHEDGAAYILEKGMSPNIMDWHHVTLLHYVAQKGNLTKAELLIRYGANINAVDEQYKTTPLGMAVRWGHLEMVQYLLKQGADPDKAGAPWATPLAWARKMAFTEIEESLIKAKKRM